MTVSAIITNYNYGRFLRAAVESVMVQTAPCSEVIVVDDGSTDGSIRVLDDLQRDYSGRLTVISQPNGGQAAAINVGFVRCTGDVICMLDADDVWHPRKVERVVTAFGAEPEAVMVMHRYSLIGSIGEVVDPDGTGPMRGGDLRQWLIATGGAWIFGATSSLSLRRAALTEILPVPAERWRLCADGAIAYPISFLGSVVSLDEVLGGYRIHGSNNHYDAGLRAEKVQADIEMTNDYLNAFLARMGRPERVDLSRNLSYRRDRYYRRGGGLKECLAVMRLILGWPLYDGPAERAKFLSRFIGRCLTRTRGTD